MIKSGLKTKAFDLSSDSQNLMCVQSLEDLVKIPGPHLRESATVGMG